MNKVRIKFKGLKEGSYTYDFNIDDHFFSEIIESEVKQADISVNIRLIVAKDLLTFIFRIEGKVSVQCDRCLDYYWQPISYETELYVEFGDHNSDLSDADNRIVLSNRAHEINLDKHIYDYVHLSIPYQRVHQEEENGETGCNLEMLKKLEEINNNNNSESDPRWDKLKDIYN